MLTRAFIDFGIEEVTGNKKAFINFTKEFLKNDIATIFPKEYLVVEILENVLIDNEVLIKCKKLKELGYTLAIDDFTYQAGYDELINLVDIIKIDFKITSIKEIPEIIKKYRRHGLSFLAEKIETREQYYSAIEMGFVYFQGYFFAKPEINSKKKFTPYKENQLKLITLLNSKNPEFEDISTLIESDLSFSYEILKLVNSAYYGQINELKSIRFALVLLGLDEIKKWLYLAFISDFRHNQPEELINISMIRAKFLESLAMRANHRELASEMLTIGMFSMIDILLNEPMSTALEEMHFIEEISDVLSGKDITGFMACCYNIVLKYEKGDWDNAACNAADLNLNNSDLNNAYIDSIKWVQKIS